MQGEKMKNTVRGLMEIKEAQNLTSLISSSSAFCMLPDRLRWSDPSSASTNLTSSWSDEFNVFVVLLDISNKLFIASMIILKTSNTVIP